MDYRKNTGDEPKGKRKAAKGKVHLYFAVLTARETNWRKRLLYVIAGLPVILMSMVLLIGLYAVLLIPLTPNVSHLDELRQHRPSVVLADNGEEITRYLKVNRVWTGFEDVPDHLVEALIATEDHRFYKHKGIDYLRIISAVAHTLTGDRQGGSTLSMQTARNLYPDEIGKKSPLTRKIKEIITASKIERTYSKEEILEIYLNSIPYLYNVVGIERSAQTYFNKSASDLGLLESATLVGMLKGTAYYNPVRHPERARTRRNVVLSQMVKHGYLEQGRFLELKERPVKLDFKPRPLRRSRAPHFTEYVRQIVEEWANKNGYDIYTDGLVIHTTLNLGLQEIAQRAVDRQLNALQAVVDVEWSGKSNSLLSTDANVYVARQKKIKPFAHFWGKQSDLVDSYIRETGRYRQGLQSGLDPKVLLDTLRTNASFMDSLRMGKTRLETGFVGIHPETGHVKAWIGSRDFVKGPFDHVVHGKRQPGSTFKPFVYAAALDQGFRPDDTLNDRVVEISTGDGKVWRPTNTGGSTGENVTLRDGLAQSKNTITAQLIQAIGPETAAEYARRMGVNKSELDEVPALALGTSAVTLLEMVSAYGTIANGGTYHEPLLITHIEDASGETLFTFDQKSETALSNETAFTIVDMMRGVIDYGTGQRIRTTFGIDADVAGKTGTTQDNADGWFIMMHPEFVGGAWVGFNDQRITFRSDYWGQGAHNALYVVGDVFRQSFRLGVLDRYALFPIYEPEYNAGDPIDDIAKQVENWIDRAFKGIFGNKSDRRNKEDRYREERKDRDELRDQSEELRELEKELREIQQEARKEALKQLKKMQEHARKQLREAEERDRLRAEWRRERDREKQRRVGW